ncbi:glycosyltransferase [bacterium]|nr:glycosyltransferase [bacterium]
MGLRILHVDSEMGYRGGQRQVQLLIEGLLARGHDCALVCPEGSALHKLAGERGWTVYPYRRPILGVRNPLLHAAVRGFARTWRPDLVHAHSGNGHSLAVSAFIGKLPVISTRRVDFAVGGNWFSRRKYTRPGQRFIAISSAVRDILIAGGVAPANIDLVYSGIDTTRVAGGDGTTLRSEWLGGTEGPLIGFIGALVDHKAPWILAEAMPTVRRSIPGARLVFVGEGSERPRIETIAAASDAGVLLAGWRDDVADCYAAFDLFVMPSKLEGLCTSLVDALAADVPCIASRAGGIPDVIADGESGDLVPPLDPEALARAIVALWNDPERRARYQQAGVERVRRLFTADAMVEGTLRAYRNLLPVPPRIAQN